MADRRIKARAKKGTFADLGLLLVEKLGDIAIEVNGILDLLRAEIGSP